jgi:hypothetical protein
MTGRLISLAAREQAAELARRAAAARAMRAWRDARQARHFEFHFRLGRRPDASRAAGRQLAPRDC